MFKHFTLANFKKLVSLLFIYKTILIWCILMHLNLDFCKNSIYSQTNFEHITIMAIFCPIVAVSLWLNTNWGILLYSLTIIIDSLFLRQFHDIYNFEILCILFLYILIFVLFCAYKLSIIYRNMY